MIVMSVIWALVGAASIFFSLMSFFLFDAPGSESSHFTQLLFASLVSLPLFWIAGAIVPWFFRKRSWAGWLFAFPLIDITAIVILFVCIQEFCGGMLACK